MTLLSLLWLLCRHKLRVNDPTFDGTTPFHWAVWRGQIRAAAWLARHGADTRARNRYARLLIEPLKMCLVFFVVLLLLFVREAKCFTPCIDSGSGKKNCSCCLLHSGTDATGVTGLHSPATWTCCAFWIACGVFPSSLWLMDKVKRELPGWQRNSVL